MSKLLMFWLEYKHDCHAGLEAENGQRQQLCFVCSFSVSLSVRAQSQSCRFAHRVENMNSTNHEAPGSGQGSGRVFYVHWHKSTEYN